LRGVPVTTVDIDFLFRKTPANIAKLKRVATELKGKVWRPYYPTGGVFRIMRDMDLLQVDFMDSIDGIPSFKGLRRRAAWISAGKGRLLVADLADIIKSKKAAGRPQDAAVLPMLEEVLAETSSQPEGKTSGDEKRK